MPFEIASSRQTSATASPTAPGRSKRPPARTGDSSTQRSTAATSSAPSTAAPPNSHRQLACSATMPVSGRPIAPPMPSDELISATPLPTRPSGSTSRMMLMPSGITPSEAPCSARATISVPTSGATAPSAEPTATSASATTSIRRLPYMSPRRPSIGAQTAPATRVAVTSQVTVEGDAPSSCGKRGRSGTTRVCINDTARPHAARTETTSAGRDLTDSGDHN